MEKSNVPVFWSVLMERSIQENAVTSLLQIASVSGMLGYKQIMTGYARVDVARNKIVKCFLEQTSDPNAVLIMLDCDHNHPVNITQRLASYTQPEIGVIGALAFRRGVPFDPCFYIRAEGGLVVPVEYGTVLKGAAVGTGAIAIKRWVFEKLSESGYHYPYFRYEYNQAEKDNLESDFPSEDMVFARMCENIGIAHWCDTSLITPHLTVAEIDQESWNQYLADNPQEFPMIDLHNEIIEEK